MRPGPSFTPKIALLCVLAAVGAAAQVPATRPNTIPSESPTSRATRGPEGMPARFGETVVGSGGATLIVQVVGEDQSSLTRQTLVKLRSEIDGWENWNTTNDKSQVTFLGVPPGNYTVEVSAAGYRPALEQLAVYASSLPVNRIIVVLRRDEAGIALSALPVSNIPANARKDAEKGLVALRSGKIKDAEKYLLKAYKKAADSADLNYLLGVLFSQKKDLSQAQTYLAKAVTLDARHVRAWTMLGGVRLQLEDHTGAVAALEQAVSVDTQYWMAHWLLANGYLEVAEFDKARQEAQLAIRTGKGAANAAQLPLGTALAHLGRREEAIAALEGFLRDVPRSPAAAQVRDTIAGLKTAGSNASAQPTVAALPAAVVTPEPRLSLPNWGPAGIDDVRPPVAIGVSCPEQQVLKGAQQRIVELVTDLSRFEAREEILHENLDELGKPLTRETRRFSYVAAFSRPDPGVPRIEEFRKGAGGTTGSPEKIATHGLPGLVFVFHPDHMDSYAMTCEGLGEWQGQATWLVHFRQREDRPNRLHAYVLGPEMHFVDLKGRAWIAASTFHIVHMEAELVRPLPGLRLLAHHQIVDYGEVTFAKKNTVLWLPKNAELYFHFQGHRFHRRHAFANFRLFSVEASDKVSAPKTTP